MERTYTTFNLSLGQGLAIVTIDNPPLNLLDSAMIADLDRLGLALQEDQETRVIVFESANPDFFIAHADLRMFLPEGPPVTPRDTESIHEILGRFHKLPLVSIAILSGHAIGGGAEFLMALDMCFASLSGARIGMFEVALGTIPGAGGTQRLPQLTGRSRALEIILGCDEFDATTAERYGWINRALPDEELRPFVMSLAKRISSFPLAAIREAKVAVAASTNPIEDGLRAESQAQMRCHSALAGEPSRLLRLIERGAQNPCFEKEQMRDELEKLGRKQNC